jgi:hypothetical protein
MGRASARAIFDPVAQALIDLGADEDLKRRVLGPLIEKLQDEGTQPPTTKGAP